MRTVHFGKKSAGDNLPTLVIAEIASAHEGDVKQFKKWIDAAAKSGADAIKVQVYQVEHLYETAVLNGLNGTQIKDFIE